MIIPLFLSYADCAVQVYCPFTTLHRRCCRGGGGGAAHNRNLPSAWLVQCLDRACSSVVNIDGQHYIPLSEAQHWFAAGVQEAEEEQHERLDAMLAERGRLQGEVMHIAEEAQRKHNEHEEAMHKLLKYALALEKELERSRAGMEEVAHEAALEAEERVMLQYQQLLIEYEHAHEVEQEALMARMDGQVKHLKGALHAAHEAKMQWRARALQVEQQFVQLRSLIERSLQQASDSALRRRQIEEQEQGEQEARMLAHPSPRIRSFDEVAPADADVAVQHPHLTVAGGHTPPSVGAKGKRHMRELI